MWLFLAPKRGQTLHYTRLGPVWEKGQGFLLSADTWHGGIPSVFRIAIGANKSHMMSVIVGFIENYYISRSRGCNKVCLLDHF